MPSDANSPHESPSNLPLYVYDETRHKRIAGNASDASKIQMSKSLAMFMGGGRAFGDSVGGQLTVVSAEIIKNPEEPEKPEARVVCEIDVKQDMVNGTGSMHGACSAYLIDVCSTLPLIALIDATKRGGIGGVSQGLDMLFHSPARVGDHLRIVSTTLSLGSRAMSARCEIWNETRHRLVASGIHNKMDPSRPPKL